MKNSIEYVLPQPATTSLAINGTEQRFPVRRVYCLARNYRAHAIEMGDDPDTAPPFFFMKPRDAVIDSKDGFPYPQATHSLRYEAELIVALQSGGENIAEDEALQHVYAYGAGLDMTRQDLQAEAKKMRRPWTGAKGFDRSAPCGPLSTVADVGHVESGRIWLSVNGDVKQDSDLRMQRWPVAKAIAILSQYFELAAGDIIMTGTPDGIGDVNVGDVIKVGIESLGEIEVKIT